MTVSPVPLIIVCGWLLLGSAYLLPGHYLPWPTFQSQWASALAMLLLATGVLRGYRDPGVSRLPVPALAWLASLLALVPPAQFALGQLAFHSDAMLSSLYLVGLALAIVTGASFVQQGQREVVPWLFGTLLAAAVISTLLALVQWLQLGSFLFIDDLRPGSRPGANLSQPNHLATLLSLGVVGLLYFYETRRLCAAVTTLLLALLGLGLVMTQSRTGWLSMGLLALWCLWKCRPLSLRLRPPAVLLAAALFVALVLSWPWLSELLLLSSSSMAERLQPGTRGLHWRVLWEAIWLEPWSGYGWQQVALAQQRTVLDFPPTWNMLQNSHNVLLDLMIWNGAWLGAAVIAYVAWWFVVQVRHSDNAERFVLVAAFAVIGVHALLEYPLDHAYFLLPFGLVIGLLGGPALRRPLLPRPLFGAALAGMFAMLLWIGDEYLKVEQANRDVRLLLAGFGVDKVPRVPPPDVVLLDGPREYHRFMITPARVGMSVEELTWMHRVMQLNAYPPAMMRYALAAGLNGRPDEAALTLKRLCHMHPEPRCDEARQSWRAAQEQLAELATVPAP